MPNPGLVVQHQRKAVGNEFNDALLVDDRHAHRLGSLESREGNIVTSHLRQLRFSVLL